MRIPTLLCVQLLRVSRIFNIQGASGHMLRALVSEVYVDARVVWSKHSVLAHTLCTSNSSPACVTRLTWDTRTHACKVQSPLNIQCSVSVIVTKSMRVRVGVQFFGIFELLRQYYRGCGKEYWFNVVFLSLHYALEHSRCCGYS
jgi:hypothetical protein